MKGYLNHLRNTSKSHHRYPWHAQVGKMFSTRNNVSLHSSLHATHTDSHTHMHGGKGNETI